jgi:hypothetical protein
MVQEMFSLNLDLFRYSDFIELNCAVLFGRDQTLSDLFAIFNL